MRGERQRMVAMPSSYRLVLLISSVVLTACGQTTTSAGGGSDPTAAGAQAPADTAQDDPSRFGDFPAEPSDRWLIGTDYLGTSFVALSGGEPLDAATVTVQFIGRYQIGIVAGGCPLGSGGFSFHDGRITGLQLGGPGVMCSPTDEATHQAALDLIQSTPEIRVDDDRLLLLGADRRLELKATGPGVVPILEDGERFIGTETTVPGVDPSRIELSSLAYFSIHLTVPACDLYGAATATADTWTFLIEPAGVDDPCEYAPASDKAAQAFFAAGVAATRTGPTIEVTGPQGLVRFRAATADDPPLQRETPSPPPRIIPPQPDRSQPPKKGRLSTPWYSQRAGSTASGDADVPLPEDWTATDPTIPEVNVVGRGYLTVTHSSSSWSPDNNSDGLSVEEGPTPVTVRLYRNESGTIVETGATVTAQQYRLGTQDSNNSRRQVVWVFERNGQTYVAVVGFPEFPDDSDFANPADPINRSLSGLDPVDLLNDIRFFE